MLACLLSGVGCQEANLVRNSNRVIFGPISQGHSELGRYEVSAGKSAIESTLTGDGIGARSSVAQVPARRCELRWLSIVRLATVRTRHGTTPLFTDC